MQPRVEPIPQQANRIGIAPAPASIAVVIPAW
ncbi:MAG: hypothetical protein QOF78_581, partial [Phycisphaerales bacterium]|nr:hypothetical protein [Phycisphaerales bacterium]